MQTFKTIFITCVSQIYKIIVIIINVFYFVQNLYLLFIDSLNFWHFVLRRKVIIMWTNKKTDDYVRVF